uniref:Hemocytin n=1 Tax=Stomoxys calcitrans TaxID=35570 RepID=A0A1I8NWB1_STOCA
MQCDPHCSEYKSCTSACPVETCDNFLQLGGEQMCKAENCIEGCQIKTCEEGLIYLNDTYKECVPKSECKPVCMIKDGITYYEGDITYQDECSTCRCSKKKEICNGVKCAEELITPNPVIDGTTLKPLKTEEQTKCVKGWTRWFDDDPYASNNVIRLDDSEKLPRYDRMESIYGTCKKEFMKKIECRVVNTHESSEFMDENVFCNLQNGLNCVGNCHDYEIRVFCECDAVAETTPKPTEKPEIGLACDSVISEYKEFPGDCHKFLHCQPKVDGSWHYVEKTCGDSMMFNPIMFVCDHIATVQELKPICGKKDDSGVLGLLCPPNTVWSDCANQCERTCHYYGQILLRRGLCKEGEHCKGGCVPSKRTECPPGRFWRDENNCVEADACPCMDSSEKYVQPHMPFVGEWEVCQCLDNAYTCLPNKLEDNRPQPPPRVNSLDPFDVFPTTISPPKKCNPENMIPVIEGEVPLPDTIFKANSSLGPNYVPSKARLLETSKENAGAWSPMINDQNQYLEITLPEPEPLFGVIMAGSPDFDNYVTLFKVQCMQSSTQTGYPIGSTFENELCEECTCVLGGHSSCKPKKCPPCKEPDQRPIVGTGCYCKCEPCPKHQRLCPSSGDCIAEVLWCNGIKDCADDEDKTCSNVILVNNKPNITSTESEIISCPVPECPPKMKMKITEKKQRKMSSMFSSTFTKKVTVNRGEDGRLTRTKVITSSEEFLGKPTEELDMVHEDDCAEFTCVPLKEVVVSRNETRSCPPPACPDKYMVELDMSSVKPGDCPPYACILKPNKDDFCEISGKVFRTFDGTEFNYETCSHILARDLLNSSWVISVHLECTDATRKVCRKTITIKDAERGATLTILPKKRLNFNGFEYTVPQLINSPICKASFVVSQVGDTVMVVSPENGFWVRYDDIGYIRIGVSSKFIKTVDGLCGYYDGNASNDKRTPDGVQMSNTAKFGDSWFDNKTPKDQCYPQTCPLKLRTQALTLCNSIKFDEFINCKKSVSYKPFATKCVETTCECLKVHNGDVKKCRCNLMEDYVKQCLTVNPHVKLDTWRAKHQCEIACPAPFVHSDCYKRRCEPSCDTLNTDDCPVLGDACFAGCYCPEGTVRKGETCVPISDCKDCVCDTIGAKKYFTYDRNSFTFNGNCTYLLSRDIVLPGVHTFQVYVTMEDCRKMGKLSAPEHSSCAKSLHILNGDHVIHIQRDPKKAKALQVLVDGFLVKKLPYKDTWINLKDVPGKELVLSLTEAHVELKASLEDLIFSLGVPSIKYGSKMEGLCGDCDGNPDNDLLPNPAKKKGRKPSKDLVDVINSWKAEEPKLGLELDECLSEVQVTEECLPLPPEKDPCMLMFDESIFGKCNMIVDPLPYISTCQQDLCKPGNDQKGSCESLSAYAKECAKQGICLDWRSPGLCPYDCPADMHYESCGCSKSCDSLQQLNEFQAVNINTNTMVNTVTSEELCAPSERYEGCFCPPNKVLENGKCISEEMCVKCEDPDHTPGERWKKDKCTECLCDKQGKTQCMERKCLVEENICAEGFVQQKKYDPEDQCCPRYTCVQEPPQALRKDCLEPLMPICGPGQFKKIKTGSDGCPQYICECKPKEECEPLTPPVALKPGEKLVKEEAGCCPTQKIVCDEKECPAKPEFCIEEFYEVYTKQEPNDCCPIYYCDPPKQVCIVPGGPNGKYTKAITDTWTDPNDSCKILQCTFGPHDSAQVVTNTVTCDTKCGPGFEYKRKDLSKCCGECVQTQCVLDGKLYEANEQWPSAVDNCTTFACVKKGESLIVSSMKETCPDVSDCPEHLLMPQEDSCCKLCKEEPHKEDLTNCLPVSLAETETRNLVKVLKPGQGFCINESPIQGFTECMGSCNSGSKYNKETFGQDKICQCCTIKSYKKISVQLTCEDGVKISKELEIPAACGCQPCSDSAEYQTSGNGFDLRVQPLPLAKMIEMKRR